MRYAKRRDANEKPLVELARKIGIQWIYAGPLDGWAWCIELEAWYPVEVKDPKKQGRKSEYTPAQIRFFDMCDQTGAPYYVWRTEQDVMAFKRGALCTG